MSYENTHSVTYSAESKAGRSHSEWLAGPTPDQSSPLRSLASRSVPLENEREKPTNATSGQSCSISSESLKYQTSVESKLRARMDLNGSMEYSLTWKARTTPAGRRICALRASARRTSDKDCSGGLGGWPTPDQHSGSGGRVSKDPLTRTRPSGTKKQLTVNEAAQLAGWATPAVATWGGSAEAHLERKRKAIANGAQMGLVVSCLDQQAMLAGWDTPQQSWAAAGATSRSGDRKDELLIGGLVRGPASSSTTAETKSTGVLNPALPRWLMGYPEEHSQLSPGFESWGIVQKMLSGS